MTLNPRGVGYASVPPSRIWTSQTHEGDCRSGQTLRAPVAQGTLRHSWPDAWEAIKGQALRPGESRTRDGEAFAREHAKDWVVISAIYSDQHRGFTEVIATRGGRRDPQSEERRLLAARAGSVTQSTVPLPPSRDHCALIRETPTANLGAPVGEERHHTRHAVSQKSHALSMQSRENAPSSGGLTAWSQGCCWRTSRQPLTTYRVLTGCPVSARGLLFGGVETGR